jgi:hypothetical protein
MVPITLYNHPTAVGARQNGTTTDRWILVDRDGNDVDHVDTETLIDLLELDDAADREADA